MVLKSTAMKKSYALVGMISFILLCGCSKDILKSYENRIIGTWRITDINKFGLGGDIDNLPFQEGTFTFNENGTLTYVNAANVSFNGSWEIRKRIVNGETIRTLQITAIDFTNQQVLTEYYDDMYFTGTNHFKASINSTLRTYVTHFRR